MSRIVSAVEKVEHTPKNMKYRENTIDILAILILSRLKQRKKEWFDNVRSASSCARVLKMLQLKQTSVYVYLASTTFKTAKSVCSSNFQSNFHHYINNWLLFRRTRRENKLLTCKWWVGPVKNAAKQKRRETKIYYYLIRNFSKFTLITSVPTHFHFTSEELHYNFTRT